MPVPETKLQALSSEVQELRGLLNEVVLSSDVKVQSTMDGLSSMLRKMEKRLEKVTHIYRQNYKYLEGRMVAFSEYLYDSSAAVTPPDTASVHSSIGSRAQELARPPLTVVCAAPPKTRSLNIAAFPFLLPYT